MRKLVVWAFMYSLDGVLADEGTEYWEFCFGLPVDPAATKQKLDVYKGACAHIMGRTPTRPWPQPCRRPTTRSPAS
jgi:hypothetical protein